MPEPLPQHLKDQLDAASHQVAAMLHAAAEADDSKSIIPADAHPDWVQHGAMATLHNWSTGFAITCAHASGLDNPQPIYGAAWLPGVVTCGACTGHLVLPESDPRNTRCGGCGHVSSGEGVDLLYAASATVGPLVWTLLCCPGCKYWDDPQAATS